MATQARSLDELKESFYNFDRDYDGILTRDELRHILLNVGAPMPAEEVEEFLNEADPHNSGKINWQEFAAVMWQGQKDQ